ncbi:DUF4198 domain-containing protein [Nitrosospira sp. NRS527]|uniref:DUF4198 domain-containing protein n=1 Tax=Nitrosospira sp. NRS527 TaxID=155925 RepID=UPI001AF7F62C|nr:DUF4198 domain-containing protein [Nitrosospira sp. NRS527]BCT68956.1 hypothetical protein NNRS527_02567 [Nitrosospira sp. NRS527]
MKITRIIPAVAIAIVGGLLSFNAAAHALWLESDKGETAVSKLYFGEYAEDRREVSPGKLDNIVQPTVAVIDANGKEKSVEASRQNNYFAIPGGGATVLVQALKQPIREPQGENPAPVQRRFLYARLGNGGSLPLDIHSSDNLLRLSFQGKPVPKAEVIIIAPNGWEKHLHTNEKGEVPLTVLEPGLYVVEAKHELINPGNFEGKAYAVESHKVTFSIYR